MLVIELPVWRAFCCQGFASMPRTNYHFFVLIDELVEGKILGRG